MAERSSKTPEPTRNADFVQSLERGLAVIRAFDGDSRELTLSDAARATGLSRATARRLLLTLTELGYVAVTDGRFSLRPRVLELGYPYLSSLSLSELAPPHMERLVARVNESSSISVLDDTDVVYVVRVPTRRIMSITLSVGSRLPSYCTSMGRVLLAGLPELELTQLLERIELRPLTPRTITNASQLRQVLARVRQRGYALTDQELEEGLRSIAVPIHDSAGTVFAALNVSVHASRGSGTTLRREVLPLLRETAAAIESDVRGSGAAPRP